MMCDRSCFSLSLSLTVWRDSWFLSGGVQCVDDDLVLQDAHTSSQHDKKSHL